MQQGDDHASLRGPSQLAFVCILQEAIVSSLKALQQDGDGTGIHPIALDPAIEIRLSQSGRLTTRIDLHHDQLSNSMQRLRPLLLVHRNTSMLMQTILEDYRRHVVDTGGAQDAALLMVRYGTSKYIYRCITLHHLIVNYVCCHYYYYNYYRYYYYHYRYYYYCYYYYCYYFYYYYYYLLLLLLLAELKECFRDSLRNRDSVCALMSLYLLFEAKVPLDWPAVYKQWQTFLKE